MKKLLLGSAALLIFAISLMIFQISCKKEAVAQSPATGITQQNKILYQKYIAATSTSEIWISNYDGSNNHKVNIALPANLRIRQESRLSPDGQKIFFGAGTATAPYNFYIYSCNVDGSNVQQVIDDGNDPDLQLMGAY